MRGVINTIVEGFTGGGSSSTSRRRHLRVAKSMNNVLNKSRRSLPDITFTDEDFQSIDLEQDYPMVVTIKTSDFAFMKTLVDQGSFVDILY